MLSADKKQLLKRTLMFAELDDSTLEVISNGCVQRSFEADSVLFTEGEPGGFMFVIVEGEVSIERISVWESTSRVTLAFRRKNEVVGEFSLFDTQVRSANARTTRESQLLQIDGRHVMHCLRGNEKLASGIIHNLVAKIKEQMDLQEEIQQKSLPTRLARIIISHARAFGQRDENNYSVVGAYLTHDELAAQLGCKRESVTRICSEWGPDLIETKRGTLVIKDRAALKSIAQIETSNH